VLPRGSRGNPLTRPEHSACSLPSLCRMQREFYRGLLEIERRGTGLSYGWFSRSSALTAAT